jgi:RNA-binding protein YhbY
MAFDKELVLYAAKTCAMLNEVKDQLMHNYLLKVHTLKHSHPRHVSVPGTILRGVRRVPS